MSSASVEMTTVTKLLASGKDGRPRFGSPWGDVAVAFISASFPTRDQGSTLAALNLSKASVKERTEFW